MDFGRETRQLVGSAVVRADAGVVLRARMVYCADGWWQCVKSVFERLLDQPLGPAMIFLSRGARPAASCMVSDLTASDALPGSLPEGTGSAESLPTFSSPSE